MRNPSPFPKGVFWPRTHHHSLLCSRISYSRLSADVVASGRTPVRETQREREFPLLASPTQTDLDAYRRRTSRSLRSFVSQTLSLTKLFYRSLVLWFLVSYSFQSDENIRRPYVAFRMFQSFGKSTRIMLTTPKVFSKRLVTFLYLKCSDFLKVLPV